MRPMPDTEPTIQSATQQFERDGFLLIPDVLESDSVEALMAKLPALASDTRGGSRNLLSWAWCAHLARQLAQHPILRAVIPHTHAAVQCTLFEKSADRNWLVSVHQDQSIPVAEPVEHAALRGWSRKDGEWFVQPPSDVLEQVVAVRLHLDDCLSNDGPVRVVPGTHQQGLIDAEKAVELKNALGERECTIHQGGVLLMRPLALHASSKSQGTSRRRVLHFIYGPVTLPFGLQWAQPVRLEPAST